MSDVEQEQKPKEPVGMGVVTHYASARDGLNIQLFDEYREKIPTLHPYPSRLNVDYPGNIRYTYLSLNLESSRDALGGTAEKGLATQNHLDLTNVVRLSEIFQEAASIIDEEISRAGKLYFEHGFVGEGGAVVETDSQDLGGRKNINLQVLSRELIDNENFKLTLNAYADGSGKGAVYPKDHDKYPGMYKNEVLAQERLSVAEKVLFEAFEKELFKDKGYQWGDAPESVALQVEQEAQELFEKRVIKNANVSLNAYGSIRADTTLRNIDERVVEFKLDRNQRSYVQGETQTQKSADMDNHEHTVVMRIGGANSQSRINYSPGRAPSSFGDDEYKVADENVNFVVQFSEERTKFFEIALKADWDTIDNTRFLIETDKDVSSVYNPDKRRVDVMVDGQEKLHILLPPGVTPLRMPVGRINEEGVFTLSTPSIDHLSPERQTEILAKDNAQVDVVEDVADKIKDLSFESKAMFLEACGDQVAYEAGLVERGICAVNPATGRLVAGSEVKEALSGMKGIETDLYEKVFTHLVTNPETADEIHSPFQTYVHLLMSHYRSEGTDFKQEELRDAHDKLLDIVEEQQAELDVDGGVKPNFLQPQNHGFNH